MTQDNSKRLLGILFPRGSLVRYHGLAAVLCNHGRVRDHVWMNSAWYCAVDQLNFKEEPYTLSNILFLRQTGQLSSSSRMLPKSKVVMDATTPPLARNDTRSMWPCAMVELVESCASAEQEFHKTCSSPKIAMGTATTITTATDTPSSRGSSKMDSTVTDMGSRVWPDPEFYYCPPAQYPVGTIVGHGSIRMAITATTATDDEKKDLSIAASPVPRAAPTARVSFHRGIWVLWDTGILRMHLLHHLQKWTDQDHDCKRRVIERRSPLPITDPISGVDVNEQLRYQQECGAWTLLGWVCGTRVRLLPFTKQTARSVWTVKEEASRVYGTFVKLVRVQISSATDGTGNGSGSALHALIRCDIATTPTMNDDGDVTSLTEVTVPMECVEIIRPASREGQRGGDSDGGHTGAGGTMGCLHPHRLVYGGRFQSFQDYQREIILSHTVATCRLAERVAVRGGDDGDKTAHVQVPAKLDGDEEDVADTVCSGRILNHHAKEISQYYNYKWRRVHSVVQGTHLYMELINFLLGVLKCDQKLVHRITHVEHFSSMEELVLLIDSPTDLTNLFGAGTSAPLLPNEDAKLERLTSSPDGEAKHTKTLSTTQTTAVITTRLSTDAVETITLYRMADERNSQKDDLKKSSSLPLPCAHHTRACDDARDALCAWRAIHRDRAL